MSMPEVSRSRTSLDNMSVFVLRRMALRVVAVGVLSLMWSALTVVAQFSPASAWAQDNYDYAPAPAPTPDINYSFYNALSDGVCSSRLCVFGGQPSILELRTHDQFD